MNQIRIAMRAIAFEYNVGECYSHTGDSNRATSFWCSSHSNRGRWIRCTTWRCRFDSLPMRIVCSECNANTAMSFWCECKLNSAMNIAIHIAVAEWDVHVNWIRWIATYRDSTVFTVFTIFSFDANLIHCLVTWAVTTLLLIFGTTFCKMSRLTVYLFFWKDLIYVEQSIRKRLASAENAENAIRFCISSPLFRSFLRLWTTVHVNTTAQSELTDDVSGQRSARVHFIYMRSAHPCTISVTGKSPIETYAAVTRALT